MMRPIRVVLAVLTTVAAACTSACASGGKAPPSARVEPSIENTPFASTLGVDFSTMTKLPSGVYYRDLEVGTGALVGPRNEVKVHYTGWLSNGTKFDGNKDSEEPLTVPLGRGAAIEGWDKGVPGMRVGGRRQLVIPAALGYGSKRSGIIPADAVLVFELQVVSAR